MPLVKNSEDATLLKHLYPEPRRYLLEDVPLLLRDLGENALLAAVDTSHVGAWGTESLGAEGMLTATVTDPELLRSVCEITHCTHLRNLTALLDRGIPVVYDSWFQCGPSGGQSPETYKTVFLPLIEETIALVHSYDALYICQDDGKMTDIIPHIVNAGADVLARIRPTE